MTTTAGLSRRIVFTAAKPLFSWTTEIPNRERKVAICSAYARSSSTIITSGR